MEKREYRYVRNRQMKIEYERQSLMYREGNATRYLNVVPYSVIIIIIYNFIIYKYYKLILYILFDTIFFNII